MPDEFRHPLDPEGIDPPACECQHPDCQECERLDAEFAAYEERERIEDELAAERAAQVEADAERDRRDAEMERVREAAVAAGAEPF